MKNRILLERLLPIYKIEHDCLLSTQGDITVAFELTLPEIFTLSHSEYEAFHQVWVKAIRMLPSHTVFHKQDWFITDQHQPDFESKKMSFLQGCSERFFNERPFLQHRCVVMLTKKPSLRKAATSLVSGLMRRSIVPPQVMDHRLFQEFLDSAAQFARVLSESGLVNVSRLRAHELAGDNNSAGLLEQYCFLHSRNRTIADISFKHGINIGNAYCELYTLGEAENMPPLCGARTNYDPYSTDRTRFSIGLASPLGLLLPCNHIFNQYIFIEDAQATIRQLESRKLRMQSLSAYSRENAIARDALNDFLNDATAGHQMPVKTHFNILAWTEDHAGIKELRSVVTAALAKMDAVPKLETDGAPQIYWAGLPGNEAEFPMNDTFDTFIEQATCFLNLETAYRTSHGPVGIRLGDRISGRPVYVDISDEPVKKGICTNRNKFILGPSGSGKSFFTNHMVRSYYEQGTHVVLVDVGHSYKGLCELVGGYYFTYEEQNPIRFNPFYISKGDCLDTEKKESIKTLLLALWKKDNENFNRSEYVALSNALQLYFDHLTKNPEIFPCFNTFYEFLRDHFVKILALDRVKEKDFDVDNFLYVLRPFYRGGEFDYLLNAETNLELLSERLIVFELDNIKDHPILFPVVTIIIMEVFISKMRKLKGVRKMILIEEAWKAIAREGMAEYIKYLFKTVRKFFGEAIVVTQDIEDIISSPVVKQAIINNSDCKILLDQSRYQNRFEQIQELLGLTEKEKTQVLSINKANGTDRNYKEVFISLGSSLSRVYATEVSLEEYLTYTTEEREKIRVYEYAARFGSMQKGVAALARDIRNTDNA